MDKETFERRKQYVNFMGRKFNDQTPKLDDYLRDNGFFTAPASTTHHGNYEGGLFDHSLMVAKTLVELTDKLGLQWEREISPYVVGMFHDLCKIDVYKEDYSFIDVGKPFFKYEDNSLLDGHGSKSVMFLARFMQLTEEEILCIRYHMGAYETDDWNRFGKAIEKYPNVLYTHMADMIASRIKGV